MTAVPPFSRGTTISDARRQLAITVPAVWLAYIGVGGDATLVRLGTWVAGTTAIPDRDYDFIAQGLNDRFLERGQDHPVPYSGDGR